MVAVAGEIGVCAVFGLISAGWRSRGREMHAEATREIERKGEKTAFFRSYMEFLVIWRLFGMTSA